ncbi:MAG: BBP7 family outer membrane beta-barrel protein [Planctomycetia bacterium]
MVTGSGTSAAAPAWENGGRALEVSDLPSVVVGAAPMPADGSPPLPPEPGAPEEIGLPVDAGVGAATGPGGSRDGVEGALQNLGERLQGFVPATPEFMAYDSAASVEPDGSVVNGSTWHGIADRFRSCDDACWVTRFEALALWRSSPSSRPLFTSLSDYTPGTIDPPTPPLGTIGPTVLDANQLVSDPAAAGRLMVARIDDCGRGFDAGYLWAGTFYSQRSLAPQTDSYALANPGIYGNSWGLIPPAPPISAAEAQLVGSLQSGEINYREPLWWGANRFLLGFRWLQWRETLTMTDQYSDPYDPAVTGTDSYRTSCLNNLYGGQLGIDSMLWNSGKGLRLEGLVKAGAYYNAAVQSSGYSYVNTAPFQSPYATVTLNHPPTCSFVGEVGLTSVIPLRSNLDLRLGYFGMWLSGLAQPTRQLSGQQLIPSGAYEPQGTLTTNGSVVLQGVSLGLEGRW